MESKIFINTETGELKTQVPISEIANYKEYDKEMYFKHHRVNAEDAIYLWRCKDENCNYVNERSYTDLAEAGEPICENCEGDMYLEDNQ